MPQEAAIPAAEATTNSRTCQQGVVNEVKVRGGKGVLNGTPFLLFRPAPSGRDGELRPLLYRRRDMILPCEFRT
jgi:hypothetical protein